MNKQQEHRELSKALAHALRHDPSRYKLTLDAQGWVSCDDVLAALRRKGRWRDLERALLDEMVDAQTKRRYEIEGDRIRALYGHSTEDVRIEKPATTPPLALFHGTSPEAAAAILADGIRPMSRQFIHLSIDVPTALSVGRRHCKKPVLFEVLAQEAAEAGYAFYEGNPQTWLADFIPAQFLVIREY